MNIINKGKGSLLVAVIISITFFISSCENPGNVGNEFVNNPKIQFDTLSIAEMNTVQFNGYTGRLGTLPAGEFADPYFGNIEITSLIKPIRNPVVPDSVELGEDFRMVLKLQFDSTATYGDTLSQSEFNIYEISSFWRGSAHRLDTDIQVNQGEMVGNFSYTDENEVYVDLSSTWRNKYYEFFDSDDGNADSLYNFTFGGLALIPQNNTNKISAIISADSKFLLINDDSSDTLAVNFKDWAYNLERTGAFSSPGTMPIHSTLESMIEVVIPDSLLRVQNSNRNIIRSDILFHEASDIMNANLNANEVRNDVENLNVYLEARTNPAYEYMFGQVSFSGIFNKEQHSYRFDITNYVNNVVFGSETRKELIIGTGSNTGYLRSVLIHGPSALEELRPKIIITSIVE